jgi:hypothetical protein
MNSIVKDIIDEVTRENSDPDDPEVLAAALRARWAESIERVKHRLTSEEASR